MGLDGAVEMGLERVQESLRMAGGVAFNVECR